MIGQMIKRYFLLNKRLFKKYSFLLILALVPFLVGGINLLSQEENGIVRIALCLKNPEDKLASGIVYELLGKDSILSYVLCEEEETAREMVLDFEADAAWIFSPDFEGDLERAAAHKRCEPVVTVVEREDNVTLRFTRQILINQIYSDFSYIIYEDFVRDDIGIDEADEAQLRAAYEKMYVEGSLFQMEYLDGEKEEENDYNYLLTPIRGILSLWFVLCGFAASMYFMQDEKNGVFSRIPLKNRLWAAFGMHGVILSDAAVVLLAAVWLAGAFTSWKRELSALFLFAVCTLLFCNLLRLLCRTPERLGAGIPILLMGMLVMCPVFIHFRSFRVLPYLLPPYYYLKSIHSVYYLYGMAIYAGVALILCVLLFQWRNRNKN